MYVCMYVCKYVCMYVSMYVCMYVCRYVGMYINGMDRCFMCIICMCVCHRVPHSSWCPPTSLESPQSKSSGLGPSLGGLHQKRLQKSACVRRSLPPPPPTYIGWFVASSIAISFGSGAGLVDRAVASNHRALTREGLWVGPCRRFSL